ncbi:Ribosomal large subunit pseudouridine synthase D [compost metagenome]
MSVVTKGTPGGKEAILDYEVIGTAAGDNLTLIRVTLLTGRPHQIRVQLSHIGCPLYGDQKYGQAFNKPGQQIALWSLYVGFPHPVSKEQIHITSLPPDEAPWSLWNRQTYEELARLL